MKGLVFSVKDYERCCIPNCNNISNTFAFPRLKKKDWSAVLAKYFKEPDWQPQSWTRICADHFRPKHVFYTNNRPVRLDPRANPFIDVKKYPLIKQEPIKPTLGYNTEPWLYCAHIRRESFIIFTYPSYSQIYSAVLL